MSAAFLDLLRKAFHKHAARPALVCAGQTYSYADLGDRARQGAAWVRSLGVAKGDRVVLCTSNKSAFLIAHLAALYAGAVTLPLNPRFTREELRFFLTDSGARAIVVGPEARAHIESLKPDLPELRVVIDESVPGDWPRATSDDPEVAAGDPALILYSSGTTGWPKGVVHTHGNMASALSALQRCWRMTPGDVVLNVLPLFHIHGLCFASQLTLLSGACLKIDDFEPLRTLQSLADCNVFMAVPTIYYRFLEMPEFRAAKGSWPRVRLFTCGSAPIRAEVLPELEGILGKPVINRYGMSEGFVITSLPLDGPWPWGSVGLPLEGVEVRIADVQPGEVGPVQLRGPNLFRTYWNNPDATRAAFALGWFDTGDLGSLDTHGFLTLVGRKNDLIITSGYNVYPQVVERVVSECPGVRECAVFGAPDARKGERVAVAVVRGDPALTEDALRTFLSDRLVDYQRPRTVLFLDALPRNAMGKILRRELIGKLTHETPGQPS